MPIVSIPISGVYETIIRPTAKDVVNRIMSETCIPSDVVILFPNESGKNKQHGSAIDDPNKQDNARFDQKSTITITITDNFNEEDLGKTAENRPEQQFLMRDDRIGIYVRPVLADVDMEVAVAYKAQSYNDAIRWRNNIRGRISEQYNIQSFDVTYFYGIPAEVLFILKELHVMRERVAPYSETFDVFQQAISSPRLTHVTNQGGSANLLACRETQTRIIGWYDFTAAPDEGSRDDEGSTWSISFTYKFRLNMPIKCNMRYPYMVHNQIVPDYLRLKPKPNDDISTRQSRSYSGMLSAYFEANYAPLQVRRGYAIPDFDDYIPPVVPPNNTRIFTALLQTGDTDVRECMNLADNGSLVFDPDILTLLQLESPYMQYANQSIFTLSLYCDYNLLDPSTFTIDKQLNVRFNFDPSLRSVYRLRLGLDTDWAGLPADVIKRIRDEGAAVIKVIDVINPGLKNIDLLPNLIDNYITKKDMDQAINDMDLNIPTGNGQVYGLNLVQTLFIEVHDANS